MLVTVFTPVYNRAYCIRRLYDSLCRQTCANFEWVVVDDGSTDNIDELMQSFIDEGKMNLRYFKQINGGKHRAINRGVKEAKGEMFFIVDSDDYITDDAIEFIISKSTDIINNRSFAGISGIDQTITGSIRTNMPTKEFLDATCLQLHNIYGIDGDMAEIFKTKILTEFPFPEIPNERFSPEDLVWNRIAKAGLKLRYFPKVLKVIEYLPDGLTSAIVRVRMNSPVASTMHYSELVQMGIPFKQKVKAAINYWRFWLCKSIAKKPSSSKKWIWTFPLGYLMHLRDLKNS